MVFRAVLWVVADGFSGVVDVPEMPSVVGYAVEDLVVEVGGEAAVD